MKKNCEVCGIEFEVVGGDTVFYYSAFVPEFSAHFALKEHLKQKIKNIGG